MCVLMSARQVRQIQHPQCPQVSIPQRFLVTPAAKQPSDLVELLMPPQQAQSVCSPQFLNAAAHYYALGDSRH
jgi:hypothetical protein